MHVRQGRFIGLLAALRIFPTGRFLAQVERFLGRIFPAGIQLRLPLEGIRGPELLHELLRAFIRFLGQGIPAVAELLVGHGPDLFAVAGGVGMMEGVVLQRDHHLLAGEMDPLQGQGRVPVLAGVGLLVVGAVVQLEGQVVLGFGHLHQAAVGDGEAEVALVGRVVIDHHPVHHPGFLVAVVDAEDVSLDSVVEGSDGDLDLGLGASDVFAHRVDVVDRVGDQPIADEEGADGDDGAGDRRGQQDAGEGDAGGVHRGELVVLAHVAEGHHRRQESRQRQGQRQHLAASPQEELQDDLELQAFADQFIDVQPQELHHQDKDGDREDREERSYE